MCTGIATVGRRASVWTKVVVRRHVALEASQESLLAATHLVLVGQVFVDEDTAAVFAGNDLFAELHINLTLWGHLVEATRARFALDGNDSQAVVCLAVDALECCHQALVGHRVLDLLGLLAHYFLLVAGFGDDLVQLALLGLKVATALFHFLAAVGLSLFEQGNLVEVLADALVGQFDFQTLVLDLLGQELILLVVLYIILLMGVLLNQLFGLRKIIEPVRLRQADAEGVGEALLVVIVVVPALFVITGPVDVEI